jgi:hypothetical protein
MPSGSIFSPRLRGVAHDAGATELSDGCQGSHRANLFAPGKGKEPKEKKEKSEKSGEPMVRGEHTEPSRNTPNREFL